MELLHQSVLLQEVLQYAQPKPGDIFIDATFGFGGYTQALLEHIGSTGMVLAFDRDEQAIKLGLQRLGNDSRVNVHHGDYRTMDEVAHQRGIHQVQGIVFDLGLSSMQLADHHRGFSFQGEGPLDMRFHVDTGITAGEIVNTYDEITLAGIIKEYGEEPLARLIARAIVQYRSETPITTTTQLAEIIKGVYQRKYHRPSETNPATRTFQALRITVNDELNALREGLSKAAALLAPGGRMVVVSFHSLEDAIVKHYFKQESRACICPPALPVCMCGHQKSLKIITKKPVTANQVELYRNPRSRSAKLRVAEKM